MYLSNAPGVWIPLSGEEFERAGQLRNEIAEVAQTAPESERHKDRLAELDTLIGFAAASAAIVETEGPEAEKKWREKNHKPWKDYMRLLAQAMVAAWHRLSRSEEQGRDKANGIALKAHRGAERPVRNNP
jgi:hypothetical protein